MRPYSLPRKDLNNAAAPRPHGPGDKYQGDYPQATLRTWAARIKAWRKDLRHIFVYFDNDQSGFVAKNALELKPMVLGR